MSTAFTPAKVKADITFLLALAVTFGFNLPTAYGVALIASAGVIAAALTFGDTLLKKYDPTLFSGLASEVHTLESSAEKILPELLPVLDALPGKIGQEIAAAIAKIEQGPQSTEITGKMKGVIPTTDGSEERAS
jgi:hypothetical protein